MNGDDNINHPRHYTSHPSGVECIIITEHMTFNVGNAMKYLWRNGLKTTHGSRLDATLEDLQKAQWYINREISRLEAEREEGEHRKAAKEALQEERRAAKRRASEIEQRVAGGAESAGEMETKV